MVFFKEMFVLLVKMYVLHDKMVVFSKEMLMFSKEILVVPKGNGYVPWEMLVFIKKCLPKNKCIDPLRKWYKCSQGNMVVFSEEMVVLHYGMVFSQV